MPDPRRPDLYRAPSSGRARTNLIAGVFLGAGFFFAAWLMNVQFSALERGERVDAPMPGPLLDLYALIGREWTVAIFAILGAGLLGYGLVTAWRERARMR